MSSERDCRCRCHLGGAFVACDVDAGTSGVPGVAYCGPHTDSRPVSAEVRRASRGGGAGLWSAVDRLTLPTRIPVERATDAEWLIDAAVEQADLATGRRLDAACSVSLYRAALAREAAANVRMATVPALWDQAVQALGAQNGMDAGTAQPLRERSPADLDLIEILAQVRDAVRDGMAQQAGTPWPVEHPIGAGEIREFARVIRVEHNLWAHRFASWCRSIETYLHVLRDQPRPFRLRAACPLCRTDYVHVDEAGRLAQDGPYLAHPIKVDFAGQSMRAAVCEACGAAWFRGADLHRLAALIGCDPIDFAAAAS